MTTTITRTPRTGTTDRINYYPNPILQNPVSGLHGGATAYAVASAVGTYSIATGNWQRLAASSLPPSTSRFGFQFSVAVAAGSGDQISIAWDFQNRTGPAPVRLYVDAITSGSTVAGHTEMTSSASSGTLTGTLTTTAAVVSVRVYVWLENTTASATGASAVEVAHPLVEKAAAPGTWFWGGQAAGGGFSYAWQGLPNSSPSLRIVPSPSDVLTVQQVNGWSGLTRPNQNTVIDVPGRTAPVVSLHVTQKRRGALEFVLGTTDADYLAADALLSQAAQFVLADTDRPAVAAMTFAIDRPGFTIDLDDETREVWVAKVPVVEQ